MTLSMHGDERVDDWVWLRERDNPEDRYEVEVKGDDYIILRERDIHAVASERMDGSTGLYL